MRELMKDKLYNYNSLHKLAMGIKNVYPLFNIDGFIKYTMDHTWDSLELKARMRKITIGLGKYLPHNYERALTVINNVVEGLPIGFNDVSLMYFPDYVEVFGQDESNWDISIAALEKYTRVSTSEFAVRAFIINNEAHMMKQMSIWARHDNEHVRRLASEGCRPSLPWG